MGKYSPFMNTASSVPSPASEESIFESEMLYESEFFEYTFKERGEFSLKVMNIPNVQIKIKVSTDSSTFQNSFTNSKMDLSFMSSQSLSSFTPNTSSLMCYDHKMNRNRPVELINFLCPVKNPNPEFCNYFGVKSSLIRKYQILNKLFKGKKNKSEENEKSLMPQTLLANINLQLPPTPETDPETQHYLTLFRNRFN